jgi:hypothetical protein
MPPITRWFVRTSLVYLAAGLVIGVLLAFKVPQGGLFPIYLHLLVFGWLTQLIMGIALWMFPKFSSTLPRGNERINWAAYFLLNIGLILRMVGEPLQSQAPSMFAGTLLVSSALLQWLAGSAFIWNIWTRVKVK